MSDPLKLRVPQELLPYLERTAEQKQLSLSQAAQWIVVRTLERDAEQHPITT